MFQTKPSNILQICGMSAEPQGIHTFVGWLTICFRLSLPICVSTIFSMQFFPQKQTARLLQCQVAFVHLVFSPWSEMGRCGIFKYIQRILHRNMKMSKLLVKPWATDSVCLSKAELNSLQWARSIKPVLLPTIETIDLCVLRWSPSRNRISSDGLRMQWGESKPFHQNTTTG